MLEALSQRRVIASPTIGVLLLFSATLILVFSGTDNQGPDYSILWGTSGELWRPDSRLPDFSFAGYRAGESPFPEPAQVVDIKNFGAKGDGITDDSEAFVEALAELNGGAILIPAGRYKITKQLVLERSNLVLRGEGSDQTVLWFPEPLSSIIGHGEHGGAHGWSFGGGVIEVRGKMEGSPITR